MRLDSPFLGSAFDAVWVKRTFMHLASPEVAMNEIARVTRPGGRVVAVEPDTEIVLLDSGMVDVTRRLLAHRATGYANPWAGRRLRRLMLRAGLVDVQATAESMEFTELDRAEATLRLLWLARSAVGSGVLSQEEADRWEDDLRSRDKSGHFACYMLTFVTTGRAPAR